MKIVHEFDGKGYHRIRIGANIGKWFRYEDYAWLNHDDKRYTATTEYWGTEAVAVSTIPEVVKTESDIVCRECGVHYAYNDKGEITEGCAHVWAEFKETSAMLNRMLNRDTSK